MFSVGSMAPAAGAESSETVFWWLVRLRWLALSGVAAVLVLAGPVLDRLPAGSTPWLWAIAVALAIYNAALALVGPERGASWLTPFGVQITIDCVALAGLVHFAGGIENPFLPLFVLHVVNANIVLGGRSAARVLGLACGLLAALVLGEGTGLVAHHCLRQPGRPCTSGALDLGALAVLGGLVLTLVASSLFARFLTERLRAGRRKLVATIDELNTEKSRLAVARAEVDTERARLQAIVDCMEDAVTFADSGGSVLFSNRRARELRRSGGPAAVLQSFEAVFAEVLAGGHPSGAAATFECGGRTFEATHSLVRTPGGETLGLVTVARDISERLTIEKELAHREQMSVLGKLAAAVAHEINNPIGVIVLYSQHALAHLPPDSPVHPHLETIRRSADNCRRIVGDLLHLARPRRPERRPVDLRKLCGEIVDSVRPLAAGAGVQVVRRAEEGEASLWTHADAGMLHQAVLNLAVNAIEAVEQGGEVSVGAYATRDGPAAAHVIEVRDTGVGIASEEIERIFQPFFTTKATGTGLGLAIAENVVRSHQGRIEVESAVGAGAVFRVLLPDGIGRDDASIPEAHDVGRPVLVAEGRR
ncbi:MAG: hypothetical protein IT294_17400 [Deltaproteobacteria bacterium]|nr:hypothetical protein [Deltaproteobacteria bacterium]